MPVVTPLASMTLIAVAEHHVRMRVGRPLRITFSRASRPASSARIPAVESVDASSTTISSKSVNVWARMLSTAARRKRASLRTGITTLTAGMER
jgi:hypothetical protein